MEDVLKYLKRESATILKDSYDGNKAATEVKFWFKLWDMNRCDLGTGKILKNAITEYIRQKKKELGAWPPSAPLSLRVLLC
jgi:hypothetical protein